MKQELEKAESYRKKFKYKTAAEEYEKILVNDPKCLDSLVGLADCMLNLERYSESKELCERAININPDLALPHTILSYIYSIQNNHKKSREEVEIGLRLNQDSAEVNCCYGTILLDENKAEEAKIFLKKSIAIDPNLYLAQYNLSVAYNVTGEFDNLSKQYRILFFLKPNYWNLTNYLGAFVGLTATRKLVFYLIPFLFIFIKNYFLFLPHLVLIWLFSSSGILALYSKQRSVAKNRLVMLSFLIFIDVVIFIVAKTN